MLGKFNITYIMRRSEQRHTAAAHSAGDATFGQTSSADFLPFELQDNSDLSSIPMASEPIA